MTQADRRQFLKAGAVASLAAAAMTPATSRSADPPAAPAATPAAAGTGVTRKLADFVVNARYADLPANVRKEGMRTLLAYVGVAVGGSHTETVDRAVAALRPFSGPKQATLMGRNDRFDVMNAASVNG